MSVEEASQEVRRILRQNDVAETLHYLSSIVRSIEANQHDLRAEIGSSYRDLVAACDGVVGMGGDCADILKIEAAVQATGAAALKAGRGSPASLLRSNRIPTAAAAAAVTPFLPPEWFAKRRQHRAHRYRKGLADTDEANNVSADGGAAIAGDSVGDNERKRGNAPGNGNKSSFLRTPALSDVVLPLPSSQGEACLGPKRHRSDTETCRDDPAARESRDEEVRLWLDDELQSLHLLYLSLAAAPDATGGHAAHALQVLFAHWSEESSPSPRDGSRDTHKTSRATDATGSTPSATEESLWMRALPLARLARRLHGVQATLAAYRSSSKTANKAGAVQEESKVNVAAPAWVAAYFRRATTLETRLVKLLLTRLRRAADVQARLAEQRAFLEASAPRDVPERNATATTVGVAEEGHHADDETNRRRHRRSVVAAEKTQSLYVGVLLAEARAVLGALGTSPTLLGALVACAPGVQLPSPTENDEALAGETAMSDLLGLASLTKSAKPLYDVARLRTREVLAKVMGGEKDSDFDIFTPVQTVAADPSRWLAALLTVLLLREAQLSAVRWTLMMKAAAAATTATRKATATAPSIYADKSSRAPATALLTSTPARLFAGPTFRSSLGLTAPDEPLSCKESPNTAWALRCFAGLSCLLRSFADFLDLLPAGASDLDVSNSTTTVLATLKAMWSADTDVQSDDAVTYAAAGDTTNTFPSTGSHGPDLRGARSLEELLTWRLKGRAGLPQSATVTAATTGAESLTSTPLGANTTLGLGRVAGASAAPSSPLNNGSVNVDGGGAARTLGWAPEDAAVSTAPVNAAARRRAYMETLRTSLNTVPELLAAPTTVTEALPMLTPNTNTLQDVRASPALLPGALVPVLTYVGRELLSPLVRTLVVLLARDPVGLAVGGGEGDRPESGWRVGGVFPPTLSAFPPEAGTHTAPNVGRTWQRVNHQRWWEATQQAAFGDALQRCVTVALQFVSFVETCLVRGLMTSTRHEMEETAQQTPAGSSADAPTRSLSEESSRRVWDADEVGRAWRALFSVLQRHTLLSDSAYHEASVTILAAAGASTTDSESEDDADNDPKRRSTSATPAGERKSNATATRATQWGATGVSSATGILWNRLRHTSSSNRRGNCPVAPHGLPARASIACDASTSQAGDGIFREEGLQWGQAALQSAQLPVTLIPAASFGASTHANSSDASENLTAEERRRLVVVLSGVCRFLLPRGGEDTGVSKTRGGSAEGGEEGQKQSSLLLLNGHAVELLQRCLHTLVMAVKAYSSRDGHTTSEAVFQGAAAASKEPAPLHTRVLQWLTHALQRVEKELRHVCTKTPATAFNAVLSYTPADVVHSYELSLVLRVYEHTLEQLSAASPEVSNLRAHAQSLYAQAQQPWQEVLITSYASSLRQLYHQQLQRSTTEGGKRDTTHAGNTTTSTNSSSNNNNDTVKGNRRALRLADSASWVRSTNAVDNVELGGRTSAYPAQPTVALTQVVQRTLRLSQQIFFGMPTVYHNSAAVGVAGRTELAVRETKATLSGQQAAPAPSSATDAFHGVACPLVETAARQCLLTQLTHATAAVFEGELLPLLSAAAPSSSESSSSPVADTQRFYSNNDGDDVRLQWCMDVLFLYAVWCPESGDGAAALFGVPSFSSSKAAASASLSTSLSASSSTPTTATADVAACVAGGPLHKVLSLLERSCDPVRWRSAAPLVLAAYRRYLSASAALWVIDGAPLAGETTNATHKTGKERATTTVAAAAAAKPFVGVNTAAHAAGLAASPSERLLQPRERVERLSLLPMTAPTAAAALIAASVAGVPRATVSLTDGAAVGIPPAGGVSYGMAVPSAAALNPYGPSMAGTGSTTTTPAAAAYRGFTSAASALPTTSSSVSNVAASAFYDGVNAGSAAFSSGGAVPSAMLGAAATAGAGASSAAAAASSLWGTTQRGWSQLWGSS